MRRLLISLLLVCSCSGFSRYETQLEAGRMDASWPACSCTPSSLCNPVSQVNESRREIFAFHVDHQHNYDWKRTINWTEVTTLAVFGLPPYASELLCWAHQRKVRIVRGVGFPNSQIPNVTARLQWITKTVADLKQGGLDGMNIDIEGNHANRGALTALVKEARHAMRRELGPTSQITFDTTIYPSATNKGYDFRALNQLLDFFVPMAYDMCWGTTTAKPNCPMSGLKEGLGKYKKLGITGDKIVIGLPWYGYDFPCTETSAPDTPCHVVKPFGGGKWQKCYNEMLEMEKSAVVAPQYTPSKDARYFAIKDSKTGKYNQLWYDDPVTLRLKYDLAKSERLRGIAFWYDECVANGDHTHMWATLSAYLQ
eukprot:TRINITY_DN39999_c0_g1_i1.p1 TRINITY_DN39999_c0_g1~~TRINITY_DN39999_c0_g1_i1.p1  ORF type:complete len:368 (+),score=8.62 TRINITY_DN39999_c0_g1_i1:42-1145(+)